jgi:hypothetical protein
MHGGLDRGEDGPECEDGKPSDGEGPKGLRDPEVDLSVQGGKW